jgi:hypothetical protein
MARLGSVPFGRPRDRGAAPALSWLHARIGVTWTGRASAYCATDPLPVSPAIGSFGL